MTMSRWESLKLFDQTNPLRLTCKYCGDVRYYSHTCYYEDRCPACGSVAFDCRRAERIKLADVPAGQIIRTAWA